MEIKMYNLVEICIHKNIWSNTEIKIHISIVIDAEIWNSSSNHLIIDEEIQTNHMLPMWRNGITVAKHKQND